MSHERVHLKFSTYRQQPQLMGGGGRDETPDYIKHYYRLPQQKVPKRVWKLCSVGGSYGRPCNPLETIVPGYQWQAWYINVSLRGMYKCLETD